MASESNQALSLIGDLRRRHVFRVAALYIVGAWLLLQIAEVIFPGLGIPEATETLVGFFVRFKELLQFVICSLGVIILVGYRLS